MAERLRGKRGAIRSPTATEPLPFPPETTKSVWFGRMESVLITDDGRRSVFVGGTLIGSFGPRDRALRNALLLGLASDPKVNRERMCAALGISSETLRLLLRVAEKDGAIAALGRGPKGRKPKVTEAIRLRVESCFDQGMTVDQAHARVKSSISRTVVVGLRKKWAAKRREPVPAPGGVGESADLPRAGDKETDAEDPDPDPATELPGLVTTPTASRCDPASVDTSMAVTSASTRSPSAETLEFTDMATPVARRMASPEERVVVCIDAGELRSGPRVQHLGTWLMIAMVATFGLHAQVEKLCGERQEEDGKGSLPKKIRATRIAVDAVIAALSIGQRCVEGVRRLATPSGPLLLRTKRSPSASWIRTTLGSLAHCLGGALLHLRMAATYIREARDADTDEPLLYYVDNHMRAYTGDQRLLKGWRMKEKRALPGTMDYYVHDADGRPVFRVDTKANSPLTAWLSPIATVLRDVLGPDTPIILGFDRAGAFPEQMRKLRDDGIGFVTYERAPYRDYPARLFSKSFLYKGEAIKYVETRTNLGKGRGRVGRIALRMPDGKQINLLTKGDIPPDVAYRFARLRWNQENALKHGNERWGGNQLDGRQFDKADPDMIIPNPARRRLDRALLLARTREGRARAKLASSRRPDARARWKMELSDALQQQKDLLAQRPQVPTHAPVAETQLADELVLHRGEYKAVIDTIRIACANAESELTARLAHYLPRPAEAKKVFANLLAAPGSVHVSKKALTVRLQPAGSKSELQAIGTLLEECNDMNLTLPGDAEKRLLRFSIQLS